MPFRRLAVALAALTCVGAASAQRPVPPKAEFLVNPPTKAERVPRAYVRFAQDRYDDILWERESLQRRVRGRRVLFQARRQGPLLALSRNRRIAIGSCAHTPRSGDSNFIAPRH